MSNPFIRLILVVLSSPSIQSSLMARPHHYYSFPFFFVFFFSCFACFVQFFLSASACAHSFVNLYTLHKDDLMKVLLLYPDQGKIIVEKTRQKRQQSKTKDSNFTNRKNVQASPRPPASGEPSSARAIAIQAAPGTAVVCPSPKASPSHRDGGAGPGPSFQFATYRPVADAVPPWISWSPAPPIRTPFIRSLIRFVPCFCQGVCPSELCASRSSGFCSLTVLLFWNSVL